MFHLATVDVEAIVNVKVVELVFLPFSTKTVKKKLLLCLTFKSKLNDYKNYTFIESTYYVGQLVYHRELSNHLN